MLRGRVSELTPDTNPLKDEISNHFQNGRNFSSSSERAQYAEGQAQLANVTTPRKPHQRKNRLLTSAEQMLRTGPAGYQLRSQFLTKRDENRTQASKSAICSNENFPYATSRNVELLFPGTITFSKFSHW